MVSLGSTIDSSETCRENFERVGLLIVGNDVRVDHLHVTPIDKIVLFRGTLRNYQ